MKVSFVGLVGVGADDKIVLKRAINIHPDMSPNLVYHVLGVYISPRDADDGGLIYYIVQDDVGRLLHVPSLLFGPASGRVPDMWVAHMGEGGGLRLEPEEFTKDDFWDRVTDYEQDALDLLERIASAMKSS